jgi:hypothetical protein
VYVNIFRIYLITFNSDTKYLVLVSTISKGFQDDTNRNTEPSGIITITSPTIMYITSNNTDTINILAVVGTILGKILYPIYVKNFWPNTKIVQQNIPHCLKNLQYQQLSKSVVLLSSQSL